MYYYDVLDGSEAVGIQEFHALLGVGEHVDWCRHSGQQSGSISENWSPYSPGTSNSTPSHSHTAT